LALDFEAPILKIFVIGSDPSSSCNPKIVQLLLKWCFGVKNLITIHDLRVKIGQENNNNNPPTFPKYLCNFVVNMTIKTGNVNNISENYLTRSLGLHLSN
jgi:hypothetical protein